MVNARLPRAVYGFTLTRLQNGLVLLASLLTAAAPERAGAAAASPACA